MHSLDPRFLLVLFGNRDYSLSLRTWLTKIWAAKLSAWLIIIESKFRVIVKAKDWTRARVMAKTLLLILETALEKEMLEVVRRLIDPARHTLDELLEWEFSPGNPGHGEGVQRRPFSFNLDWWSMGCYQTSEEQMVGRDGQWWISQTNGIRNPDVFRSYRWKDSHATYARRYCLSLPAPRVYCGRYSKCVCRLPGKHVSESIRCHPGGFGSDLLNFGAVLEADSLDLATTEMRLWNSRVSRFLKICCGRNRSIHANMILSILRLLDQSISDYLGL